MAEILRGDKTASPKTAKLVLCVGLVLLESAFGVRFKIQRKTLTHQQLVQARCFTVHGANADVPLLVGFVWPQILAVDSALANQIRKMIARFHATRPRFGVFVDAHLVTLRSVDAVEFVGNLGKLDGVSVLDDCVQGPTRTCPEKCQDNDQKTHRLNPESAETMISQGYYRITGTRGRVRNAKSK